MPIILAGAVCKGLTKKKIGSGSGAALKVAAPALAPAPQHCYLAIVQ